MNIFALDKDPKKAARYHSDKHCVKMILESAQMLSSAHHMIDGSEAPEGIYRNSFWNHPCTIWVRTNIANYRWTFSLFEELIKEYKFRYKRDHKCTNLLEPLRNPPKNIDPATELTPFALAMPEERRKGGGVQAYRSYYQIEKRKINVWKYRSKPNWYRPKSSN